MKKLFLIIGAPGSGKTTDASIIAKNDSKFSHYSTGDLLRAEVASGSDLGRLIDSFISKGNLVPLDVVVNTIVSAIKSSPTEYILIDGYPRSVEQMLELDKVLSNTDDNDEVFNNRMKVYLAPLKEIRDFYSSKSLLRNINGERTIEEIVSDMTN